MNRYLDAARMLRVGLALVAICFALAPRAHADNIPAAMIQSTTMVTGNASTVYTLNTNGPGKLTVRLENISWPERLASLDCSIYSNDGLVTALQGTTEWSLMTTGPASFYANVLAGAGGRLNMGLFSIRMTFESAASLVPLPAAGWLLASVLGFFGLRRSAPILRFALGRERFA